MSPPKPLVAIVGRPNVGKSTLANRIVGRRAAVVQEKPGVTRDRREFPADWNGRSFTVVDTGGWQQGKDADLIEDICLQAEMAIAAADLILFVVDAQGEITSDDAAVARLLRPETDRVVMVANKADNDALSRESAAFTRLGLGEPIPVSAIHGYGVADLLDVLVRRLPDPPDGDFVEDPMPDVAVIGRPNVGKSTLLNRLVGDERVLVSPVPGTTRDPIDVMVELDGAAYRLIDTAGMRRKPKMSEDVEFFSVLRAREVLRRAHAALLMVDATDGVTHQDQRIARLAADSGAALVILANKWDAADLEQREQTTYELGARLGFAGWGPGSPHLGPHRGAPAPAGFSPRDCAREPIPPYSDRRTQPAHHRDGSRAPSSREERPAPQDPLRRAIPAGPSHHRLVRQGKARPSLPAIHREAAPPGLRLHGYAGSDSGAAGRWTRRTMTNPTGPDPDRRPPGAPLSFKLMVALAALYLGWRLVEGVIALYRWVF